MVVLARPEQAGKHQVGALEDLGREAETGAEQEQYRRRPSVVQTLAQAFVANASFCTCGCIAQKRTPPAGSFNVSYNLFEFGEHVHELDCEGPALVELAAVAALEPVLTDAFGKGTKLFERMYDVERAHSVRA